jgi:hypothetical protein
MKQEKIKPHNFCETPEEKCTMNYCDTNGCQNRKRELVEPKEQFKQETLEEVGLYQQELFNYLHDLGIIALQSEMQEIERIVLSMQEQDNNKYSEEEVREMCSDAISSCTDGLSSHYQNFQEWFEQNKKK